MRKEIPANGNQKRLNILGAMNLADMAVRTQTYETINADAIIAFLTALLSALPGITLNINLDRARYHICAVAAARAAENPRINCTPARL